MCIRDSNYNNKSISHVSKLPVVKCISCLTVVDCQHPGPIENGRVIVMNQSTTYNSAVEYHCIPHYQRIGPYLRKCMDDGQWSGEEPRCESKWVHYIHSYTLS